MFTQLPHKIWLFKRGYCTFSSRVALDMWTNRIEPHRKYRQIRPQTIYCLGRKGVRHPLSSWIFDSHSNCRARTHYRGKLISRRLGLELTYMLQKYVQSDEADMGMTYDELTVSCIDNIKLYWTNSLGLDLWSFTKGLQTGSIWHVSETRTWMGRGKSTRRRRWMPSLGTSSDRVCRLQTMFCGIILLTYPQGKSQALFSLLWVLSLLENQAHTAN